MADGIFNLCGRRAVELTKDGRTYRLAVRILDEYALKEEAILAKVGSPYAGIEAISDPAIRQQAMRIAADIASRPLIATMEDEARFDGSFRGLAWSLWRALSVNHPDEFPPGLPAAKGVQLGCDFIAWYGNAADLVRAIHHVEEKDRLGN